MGGAGVLEQLYFARQIADHAARLGVLSAPMSSRPASNHMGAVLADAILQAGVNYQTVVRVRIERIRLEFPEAAMLSGVTELIEREGAEFFLLWKHPTKVIRFVSLAKFLAMQGVDSTTELRNWLCLENARPSLLNLNGIGPKTCDYLCSLVGIDCVAVDRHIVRFAVDAGVHLSDYERLKGAVSFAADLLGVERRDFDAWIWRTISYRTRAPEIDSLGTQPGR
ncbi:MAG: hypothetical protein HXY30_20990 [Pseudorhodoplanes sp.]|nr:hypothetical protein [Pseudorhodoplanes sp.]